MIKSVEKATSSKSGIEQELLSSLQFYGIKKLSESLRLIHDIALYDSDQTLGEKEKSALFDLKILWEQLDQLDSFD